MVCIVLMQCSLLYRQSNLPPRFQDWSEQRTAEREAAIAAAAAATGNKGIMMQFYFLFILILSLLMLLFN